MLFVVLILFEFDLFNKLIVLSTAATPAGTVSETLAFSAIWFNFKGGASLPGHGTKIGCEKCGSYTTAWYKSEGISVVLLFFPVKLLNTVIVGHAHVQQSSLYGMRHG